MASLKYIDLSLYTNYEKNMKIIQKMIKQSGQHTIDRQKANLFIENQISSIRRQAARDLIDNTIYISFQEVVNTTRTLIQKLYRDILSTDDKKTKQVYFYCGVPNKSYYFLNALALSFIKEFNFPHPIFLNSFHLDDFEIIQDNPFVILDDVSYSGSQMSQMLHEIYYHIHILKKQKVPNIHVLLLAVNTHALEILKKVPRKQIPKSKFLSYTAYRDFIPSPFHIHYLDEYKYPTLAEKIGPERYSYLNLFFSPTTEQQPYLSLYLDHKIADELSTYMKALIYGPIVPANYDYKKLFKNNDSNSEFVKGKSVNDLIENILEKKLDVIDKTNTEFRLYPFLNSCFNQPIMKQLEKQIQQTTMDYSFFISRQECIVPDGIFHYEFPIDPKTQKIIETINNFKCPKSFYKEKTWGLLESVQKRSKSRTVRKGSKSKSLKTLRSRRTNSI